MKYLVSLILITVFSSARADIAECTWMAYDVNRSTGEITKKLNSIIDNKKVKFVIELNPKTMDQSSRGINNSRTICVILEK
jgi:hypothetical protein